MTQPYNDPPKYTQNDLISKLTYQLGNNPFAKAVATAVVVFLAALGALYVKDPGGSQPPPVTTTTIPTTTVPTTIKPTTSTAKPTTTVGPTTTVAPTTTTSIPPGAGFPTAETTGVPAGTVFKQWTGSWDTRNHNELPTQSIGGQTCKIIDGYEFKATTEYLAVGDSCVYIKNSKFSITGTVSNTSAMVQGSGSTLNVTRSEFNGNWNRGIQSDSANLTVTFSKFLNTGDSAVEKNNRQGASDYTISDNFIYVDRGGWPPSAHVDGLQVGGAHNITITHNTVLIFLWQNALGNESSVSNSALGLWAELGNVTGTVLVDNNLLSGGGRTIYLQQKAPYSWQGPVIVSNNIFDTRWSNKSAVWGPLANVGLPSNLTWTNNKFSDGRVLTLAAANNNYP